MSTRTEKPTLSGQRIKTRKRDEKEKYDPTGFRDAIVQGLTETGSDLEQVSKFLDTAGSKLDYRRYGETLFDILLAGGILAPGGTLALDVDPSKNCRTEICIFNADDSLENLKCYSQVLTKLIRRYKYLEKTLEDEFKKVLVFLKGFTPDERAKLGRVTAILVAGGQIPATVLSNTLQDHLVKDGIALDFIMEVLNAWLGEKDSTTVWTSLRKAGLDTRLMEFFPVSKRTPEHLSITFKAHGLGQLLEYLASDIRGKSMIFCLRAIAKTVVTQAGNEIDERNKNRIIDYLINFLMISNMTSFGQFGTSRSCCELFDLEFLKAKAQENQSVKKELQQQVAELLKEGAAGKDIIPIVKDHMRRHALPEPDVAVLLWSSIMAMMEWNKKEALVPEQAVKHLRQYTSLFSAFTQNAKAELALLVKMQEFCYDNMNFMKVFQKIVFLFYKSEVLSEDVIMKWYKEAHSPKGKSIFLDQMQKFIEWLQNAEEESEAED